MCERMEILLGIIVMILVLVNAVLLVMVMRRERQGQSGNDGLTEQMRRDIEELKRTLTGVKTRGIWGEWQLGSILDEMLTKDQYETECMVIPGSTNRVEYAVKLPGRFEQAVYLPIDSKFPLDAYVQLEEARNSGSREMADDAEILFKNRVRGFAKEIHDKYIMPPYTTDFAILFFPVEAIYVEAVKCGLGQELMRKYKITMASPESISVLINTLQMGFRTLEIEEKSGEAWRVLTEVRSEVDKYEEVLNNLQKRIEQSAKELELLVGRRTRILKKKLEMIDEDGGFYEDL